jgi:hypothetical protein
VRLRESNALDAQHWWLIFEDGTARAFDSKEAADIWMKLQQPPLGAALSSPPREKRFADSTDTPVTDPILASPAVEDNWLWLGGDCSTAPEQACRRCVELCP